MGPEANVRYAKGVAIVDMPSRLMSGGAAGRLRDLLIQLFEQGKSRIVINLAAVQHADSGGLGDLVAAHAAITRRGGSAKLAQPPEKMRAMLRMTHIDSLFEVFDDEAAAIKSFPAADAAHRVDSVTDFFDG